ncbi:hypothetical protein MF545_12700 [Stenotrophomonas maltophilia]|nr:hypothetical protein [Stenotrophomonas maltophilia]
MTDHDFFAAMAVGIPPITPPAGPTSADATGVIKGNADIATDHPDAVGATKDQSA